MRDKARIDTLVAKHTGVSRDEVKEITSELIDVVRKLLIDEGEVYLDGLGGLRLKMYKRGKRHILKKKMKTAWMARIQFHKAATLRHLIKRNIDALIGKELAMEKYAVDEQVDQDKMEKMSSEGCPKCGTKPVRHGKVLMCPKCGSEPYEKHD